MVAVLITIPIVFLFGISKGFSIETTSASLILVTEGKAQSIIIVPSSHSPVEQFAAETLAKFLQRISGAHIPIISEGAEFSIGKTIISIGHTKMAIKAGIDKRLIALAQDSFAVLTKPDKGVLFLAGNGDLGASFAVSHFLESLGIRWFYPGDSGLVIPKMRDITIGTLDAISTPHFPIRAIGGKREPEWALFNRMNVTVHPKLGRKVFSYAHTFFRFLPPKKYFRNHPEWYSLIDGTRQPRQLCTSNPEVIRAMSDAIIRFLEESSAKNLVPLFPQDGLGFCECEACKALDNSSKLSVEDINKKWRKLGQERYGALSGRMLSFYREVSSQVLSEMPDSIILVAAYNPYLYPPNNKMKPFPKNVILQICRGWDHNHSLTSDTSEFNIRLQKAIKVWERIFSKLGVYEYYCKLSMLDLPFPILHTVVEDIRFYRNHNVKSFYTQFGSDFCSNGFLYYVATKLLWDSSQDVYSLLNSFCHDFYGEAGATMRDYYLNFEKAAIDFGKTLAAPVWELPILFSPRVLLRQKQLLAIAKKEAHTIPVRRRIARVEVSLDYVSMCMDYIRMAGKVANGKSDLQDLLKLQKMAEKIRDFRASQNDACCFNHETKYIKRFLTPSWLVRQISIANRKI
jgi:hypothetical protein